MREADKDGLDSGLLVFGMIVGLIIGGLLTLFKAPASGKAFRSQIVSETGQNLRTTIEAVVPSDPLAESMAEGKAAARRRLAELGEPGRP
jgi:gas vesicle protein